jgi:hypothetical protein
MTSFFNKSSTASLCPANSLLAMHHLLTVPAATLLGPAAAAAAESSNPASLHEEQQLHSRILCTVVSLHSSSSRTSARSRDWQ